jgi:hypothetical protein
MRQVIRNRILYELREGEGTRWWRASKRVLRDFPLRFARGIVGTPSSQPPLVILKAYLDLLRIGRRLVSESHDKAEWQRYLEDLGWPPSQSKGCTLRDEASAMA